MVLIYNRRSSLERITILDTTTAKEGSGRHTDMQCIFDKTFLVHGQTIRNLSLPVKGIVTTIKSVFRFPS